jgi:hypothetical protein
VLEAKLFLTGEGCCLNTLLLADHEQREAWLADLELDLGNLDLRV